MQGTSLGDDLRRERLERGLSQAALARLAGTSQSQIARLESGRQDPGLSTWRRVFAPLGVSLNIVTSPDGPNPHRLQEVRSRVLHAIVAEKARRDPRILTRARQRVADWERAGGPTHPTWTRAWRDLLDRDDEDVLRAIASDDPQMRDMRQSSPFAGALTDEERLGVIRGLSDLQGIPV